MPADRRLPQPEFAFGRLLRIVGKEKLLEQIDHRRFLEQLHLSPSVGRALNSGIMARAGCGCPSASRCHLHVQQGGGIHALLLADDVLGTLVRVSGIRIDLGDEFSTPEKLQRNVGWIDFWGRPSYHGARTHLA